MTAVLQDTRRVGVVLIATVLTALGAFFALAAGPSAGNAHAAHNSAAGDAKGVTDGWFDGETVDFFYPKDFYCDTSVPAGSTSGCELGAAAEKPPRPGSDVPVLYVMVPLFGGVDPATLQCPTAGSCVNHPTTIDLSRVFGAGTENALLPPHSHVVDEARGGWWEIEVVGVPTQAAWDRVVDGKDLETVRQLQAEGAATGDIPTNLFLFFNVQS